MRRFILFTLPLMFAACAPLNQAPAPSIDSHYIPAHAYTHANYNPGLQTQPYKKVVYGTRHAHPNKRFVQRSLSPQAPRPQQATDIYPTGRGTLNAPQHNAWKQKPPALRGRNKASLYGNLGLGSLDIKSDVYGVVGRVGIEDDYFGAEVEAMTSLTQDTTDIDFTGPNNTLIAGKVDANVDYTLAAFGVARLNITPKAKLYLRGGYHKTQIGVSQSAPEHADIKRSEFVDGFAVGAGIEYFTSDKNGWRLDVTGYEYDTYDWAKSLTASYIRRF